MGAWQPVEELEPAVGPTFQSVALSRSERLDRLESLSHIPLQQAVRHAATSVWHGFVVCDSVWRRCATCDSTG